MSDTLLSLHITCFAAIVPMLLRLKLTTVERIVVPRHVAGPPDPGRAATIITLTETALTRRFVRSTCLVRGTTLYYFLSRSGMNVQLHFGIGTVDGRFAGHCWLERGGLPYLETHDPTQVFASVYRIPGEGTSAARDAFPLGILR